MPDAPARDPRVDPMSGDAFRKWNQVFVIRHVIQGCVYSTPSLTAHGAWISIQEFRKWAADAEVLQVASEKERK